MKACDQRRIMMLLCETLTDLGRIFEAGKSLDVLLHAALRTLGICTSENDMIAWRKAEAVVETHRVAQSAKDWIRVDQAAPVVRWVAVAFIRQS